MSWIELFLTGLEARLRLLIEGDAASDGFPKRLHWQLQYRLVQALKANAQILPNLTSKAGLIRTAPDQYTLVLPAVEAEILLSHPTELDRLALVLENAAAHAGIGLPAAPMLRVVADPQVIEVAVQVGYTKPGRDDSHTDQLEEPLDSLAQASNAWLPNAFLIVNGLSTFPLSLPVINIGSDPSNQLRLNDPQVSGQHAQLRFLHGRFVIFDLDSRQGTLVNGVAISSRALNPGDVIQLGSLPLVYGQEAALADTQTQPLPATPPPPEVL